MAGEEVRNISRLNLNEYIETLHLAWNKYRRKIKDGKSRNEWKSGL